jgi:hypothetical protein
MKQAARNPIIAPRVKEVDPPKDPFLVRLYGLKKLVTLVICYDRPGPPVYLESEFSNHILDELFEAAKAKATIKEVLIDGKPVTPASLARINHFVSQPGFSKPTTFRGWRKRNKARENGFIYWRSATAWEQFEEVVMLTIYKPLNTPAKT